MNLLISFPFYAALGQGILFIRVTASAVTGAKRGAKPADSSARITVMAHCRKN